MTAPRRVSGIEAAQLRALAGAMAEVSDDAVVALSLTDAGILSVQIDHPDAARPRTWLAVDITAEVLRAIGPSAGPHSNPAGSDDRDDQRPPTLGPGQSRRARD